ncbi:MAG: hypothetical protein ACOYJY_03325 [Acutalibacteraceae bacterium]|jgi:CobQ-like glutamine amidotransferase family enzyme
MIVEILFPEYANLYGDTGNVRYLRRCLPEAEFVETAMHAQPAFVTRDVDLIYMGPMSENAQERAIARLRPYADRLRELIERDKVFLLTGNAMEVFGERIENEDGSGIDGLGLIPIVAKRDMMHRYAASYKGFFGETPVVGFKAQFTTAYPTKPGLPFLHTTHSMGLNRKETGEGVRIHNLFGTYLLGPLLIMNPPFARYLLGLLGVTPDALPFEEQAMQAYRNRLKDFE